MRQNEYRIEVYLDDSKGCYLYNDFLRVVYSAGKDCIGLIFADKECSVYKIYKISLVGTRRDLFRVIKALKTNNYTIVCVAEYIKYDQL